MAKSITVTTATLKSKAGELRTKNGDLKQRIDDLNNLESSLNSMWEGEAKDAFHSAFTSDTQQMTQFYNAIQNYVTALEQIAGQYEKTEAANQNIASQRSYK